MQERVAQLADHHHDAPSDAEVHAALAAILGSPGFPASPRRRRLLSFLVTETLAGRGAGLKGFTIAVEVFGRDETFDPQNDPVVRFEARRLRQDLDSYYAGPGAQDVVRITVPKGGYLPTFETRALAHRTLEGPEARDDPATEEQPGPHLHAAAAGRRQPRRRAGLATALAGAGLAGIVAIGWTLWPLDPTSRDAAAGNDLPKIVVMPFRAVDDSMTTAALATGLASEVVLDLNRFRQLRLFQPVGESELPTQLDAVRALGGPLYLVQGNILTEDGRANVTVHLLEGATGEVVWSQDLDTALTPGAVMNLRDEIAGEVATQVGQPYGAVDTDVLRRNAATEPAELQSYLCVLQGYAYRRTFDAGAYGRTRACLEAAVAREPDYADAWAMLGWLYLDDGRFGFSGGDRAQLFDRALETTRKAVALDPDGLLGLKALSSTLYYSGHYAEAESVIRRAVALNPYDPDTLAQLGWRLAARGNFGEGVPVLKTAVARSLDPPGWYYHLIIVSQYLDGDYDGMLATANLSAKDGSALSNMFVAIAAAKLGQRATALAALAKVPSDSIVRRDPEAFFRLHGSTDAIVVAMSDAVRDVVRTLQDANGG